MQWSANDCETSPRSRADWSTQLMMTGLKTFSSNWPLLPEIPTVTWLPITWAATIVTASHCVGFTLPVQNNDYNYYYNCCNCYSTDISHWHCHQLPCGVYKHGKTCSRPYCSNLWPKNWDCFKRQWNEINGTIAVKMWMWKRSETKIRTTMKKHKRLRSKK